MLLGSSSPTSSTAAALLHATPLPFTGYLRRRASPSDWHGPSRATVAAANHNFVSVQYQLIASVTVIFPDHFIYSDNRGRHRHILSHVDWHRNRRRVLLCWPLRPGVQLILVPVYACPVMATPMRAFVHDVSRGLASLVRRLVYTD